MNVPIEELFDEVYHILNRDDLGRVHRVEEAIKLFKKHGFDPTKTRFKRAPLFNAALRRCDIRHRAIKDNLYKQLLLSWGEEG